MSMTARSRPLLAAPRPIRAAALPAALALGLLSSHARGADPAPAPEANPTLSVVSRTLTQDQGGWLIDYRLRYRGASAMSVSPTEVVVKIEGWVSNSRVAAHATADHGLTDVPPELVAAVRAHIVNVG